MLLDFKTIVLLVAISSFLYAFTIAFFASQANQYKGITLYMWGSVCAAFGFLVTVSYNTFPVPLVRFAAAGFLIISVYFYCLGVARFLGFDFKAQRLFYFLVSGLGILSYFVFFDTTNNMGNTVAPFYSATFYAIGSYFLWQRRNESFANSIYFVLVNFVFIALVLTARCYAVLIYHIESSFEGNPINNGFMMALFISGYLRNVGFIVMISQRLYLDLREMATQDFLTKIHNRRATQQLLDKEFQHVQRYNSACSLILLDIDYFKSVNDNYGHETGDKVLQTVATILKTQLRKTDTLGRWGGEEFLIILPNTDIKNALEVTEKLRTVVAETTIDGISCTISLGVKMIDTQDLSIDEAVKRTDDALYKAKDKGRNCVVAYSSE